MDIRRAWHRTTFAIRIRWNRLWIRKDEFHPSLSMDPIAMMYMDEKEKGDYLADLVRRREIAHQRDMERSG